MLLFADGFEHYGGDESAMLAGLWGALTTHDGGTITLSTTVARTGTTSLKMTSGNLSGSIQDARLAFGTTADTCGIGFGVYLPNLPSSNQQVGFQLRNASNVAILTGCIQSDGSICMRKGNHTGTIVDVSDAILSAGTFNHIECKAVFDTVAGALEVRVNGVTKLQIGSLNLGADGAATGDLMIFDFPTGFTVYWADLFVWDDTGTENNDFIGAQRILTIMPDADTAQADFTVVGTTDGFDAISDIPPDGDTTYLYSATVGDKSDFALPTLPPELTAIAAVFVPAMAKLDAAGIGNLLISMVSGASDAPGNDNPLTTGYTYYKNVFELDPDTSAPWTKSGLEAALLRVEKSL